MRTGVRDGENAVKKKKKQEFNPVLENFAIRVPFLELSCIKCLFFIFFYIMWLLGNRGERVEI